MLKQKMKNGVLYIWNVCAGCCRICLLAFAIHVCIEETAVDKIQIKTYLLVGWCAVLSFICFSFSRFFSIVFFALGVIFDLDA